MGPDGAAPGAHGLRQLRARHPIASFVARRLVAAVLTLLVVSILIFVVLQVLPGNVAQVILGQHATPARVHAIEVQLHLNQSVPVRYVHFIGHLLTGNLGYSSAAIAQGSRVSVWQEIRTPLRNSLVLAGVTIVLFIPLCLILGTAMAVRAGRATDSILSVVALALGAMPEFLIGTLLIVIFFTQLNLLPPVSSIGTGQTPFTHPDGLILPALTLLGVSTAFGTRLLRASLVETLGQDFVSMARLNGYRERRVLFRYALRNALAPSVQILAQQIQYLVGGIIVTESVFNYPGIGTTLVQSISVRDTQVVSIIAVMLATIYVLLNVAADLAVVLLVPKLRTKA